MRSTYSRGARRLLVTAGVMTLGLAAVAPAAVMAAGRPPSGVGLPGAHAMVDMVWVCHPTEDGSWELIYINDSALPAHVAQGGVPVPDEMIGALEALAVNEYHIVLGSPASLNQLGDAEEQVLTDAACGNLYTDPQDPGDEGPDDQGEDDQGSVGDEPGNEFPGGGETDGQFPGGGATDGEFPGGGPGDDIDDDEVDDTDGGPSGDGGTGTPAAPAPSTPQAPPAPVVLPAPPVQNPAPVTPPLGDRPPKPVIISTDGVTKPVAAPVATPAAPQTSGPEVLGAVTTRTPTPVAGQELPRTGSDLTMVLAVAGIALVLAGAALEAASRRAGATVTA